MNKIKDILRKLKAHFVSASSDKVHVGGWIWIGGVIIVTLISIFFKACKGS